MNPDLRIDGERLWRAVMDMAQIGATEAGGCNRQALTDADRAGRDLFVSWCKAAGCRVVVDQIGNLFARRPGRHPQAPPLCAGSHLDTQPTGGKFDGVFGVLAGLEVVRTLNDAGIETRHPLEIAVWTNEEGARFSPAMMGSGVWAGVFELEDAYARRDRDGRTLGEELERIGYRGSVPARARPLCGAFEAHIEQGPILERAGQPIGIVTGVQGMRWYDVSIEGRACHAGTTPMAMRRDPVRAAARIVERLYELAADVGPAARVTFGDVAVRPGARNTVPDRLVLALDLRHPDPVVLSELERTLRRIVEETCSATATRGSVRVEWDSPAVEFDRRCVEAVREAALALGYPAREMVSGAGHDSVYLARVAPTAMIFVPCAEGLSHNEAESARLEDLEAGANVLLHALLRRDAAQPEQTPFASSRGAIHEA